MAISQRAAALAILVVALAASVATTLAQAEIVSLVPTGDTTIYSESGDLSNGAGEFVFSGRTARSTTRRALLRFDVAASVRPGSTISTVTLTLHPSQSPGSSEPPLPQSFVLHRVIAPWGEGTSDARTPGGFGTRATVNDATWTYRFWYSDVWTTPGGDFNPSESAHTVISVTNDAFVVWGPTAEMVRDVRDWLDQPATNFGWILIGNEALDKTARRFDSRESRKVTYRPVLTIEFIPPH
jgi:hypothetical protein